VDIGILIVRQRLFVGRWNPAWRAGSLQLAWSAVQERSIHRVSQWPGVWHELVPDGGGGPDTSKRRTAASH